MWALIFALVLLVPAAVSAQTPEQAVADVVANSGSFPLGTTVVNAAIAGDSAVVELSAEAAPADLGDEQADAMGKAIMDALDEFGVKALEVTVGGYALWEYLPPSIAPDGSSSDVGVQSVGDEIGISSIAGDDQIGIASIGGGGGAGSVVAVLTNELSGKGVALHPSHGMYWHQAYNRWFVSMRTLCGPNPSPPLPPGWDSLWQSVYQPSNYYYWTKVFQWGSFYEDYRTPQEIRFLRSYLESSGANVVVSRNLDKEAGDFDYNAYGYPNCSYPIPKWATAAKYHLQEIGAPQTVWDEPALTAQSDKDIRARPYWANYNMIGKWPLTADEKLAVQNNTSLWQSWVSIHLHTNAAGAGGARGTETYWYTSTYPWLKTQAVALAGAFNTATVNAIKNEYDGLWACAQYPYTGVNPPEWPYTTAYPGYTHNTGATASQWQNRGVKTSNFGEIREAMMPAILMEMLFHDDWKFFPDHVFALDQNFQATAAWGMYEGICNYWAITPKPRMAASVDSVSFPTLVGPNAAISGSVTMTNEGMAWCWGDKWVTMVYAPYTVWKLQATANDQFVAGEKINLAADAVVYPSETTSFAVNLTAPAVTGLYTTEWQMLKDDAMGGSFGGVATAQIQVDADPPVITIASPTASDYPYGQTAVQFTATDALSSVAGISADIDGAPVQSGDIVVGLALGAHTLTVTAADIFGNTATETVTFNIVNSVGTTTVGGWIELANKKGTCCIECKYTEGAPVPTGEVTYQDHDTKMTVKSVQMIAMGIVGNHAWMYGTCTIECEPGHWFRIDVIDNGEPGFDDEFYITLDTGYVQGGKLGAGNVEIY